MKRIFFICTVLLIAVWSCRDEEVTPKARSLAFSADTLLFDTLFTTVGSITKRLKIYNPNDFRVSIENIQLSGGVSSPFGLVVNGQSGFDFQEIQLFSKDSALLLVSVTIDPMDQDLPFIVQDKIVVTSAGQTWEVDLVAWGQDAIFYNDEVIACDDTWEAGRPIVIYNSVLVDSNCTLTIDPGVKIYSHPGSIFYVKGALEAQGNPDDRILFTGDRLENDLKNTSGQWGGIYFLEGSEENFLSFVDIRNAVLGLRLGTPDDDSVPDVVISESKIENMSEYGILAFTSDLHATNLLINNCGVSAIANVAGGNYIYEHCTFAAYPIDFLIEGPAAVFSNNLVLEDDNLLVADLFVDMSNSVIWGLGENEIQFSESPTALFDVNFEYSLLKLSDPEITENNVITNEDPLFIAPQMYDFTPGEGSPLIDAGEDLGVTTDLNGNTRSIPPEIGAIEKL